jgi:hypothetical protein
MTSSYRRPNPEAFHVEAKVSGHYVNSILACQEAKDKGFDEALVLDSKGFVAESSGANIFLKRMVFCTLLQKGIYYRALQEKLFWNYVLICRFLLKKVYLLLMKCRVLTLVFLWHCCRGGGTKFTGQYPFQKEMGRYIQSPNTTGL